MSTKETVINLPKSAYTSQEWFDQEQTMIFEKNWQFAGFIEDLPEPGSYMTVQVGRYNLFIIRDEDNLLHAFHNLCRHRGTQLLRSCGKAGKTITCPYHDWSYSQADELLAILQQAIEFKDINKK